MTIIGKALALIKNGKLSLLFTEQPEEVHRVYCEQQRRENLEADQQRSRSQLALSGFWRYIS